MKLVKSFLCIFLSVIFAVVLIQPGLMTGKGTLDGFLRTANTKQHNTPSDAFETETHAQLKQAALKADKQNIVDAGGEDFFRDTVATSVSPLSENVGYVADEVLILFEDGVSIFDKLSLINEIGGSVVGYTAILNQYQVKVEARSFEALNALCEKLTQRDDVALAACNMAFICSETEVPNDPWTNADGGDEACGWDESNPDGGNWWLEATETVSAWDYSEYFNKIKVGVLDGGFDTAHEDLAGKITFPSKWFERHSAPSSHGTHVAGIIAAKANNKKGITGICDKAELVCADWEADTDNQHWVNEERIVTGFIALVLSGAKVINLSLGSSGVFEEKYSRFWKVGMDIEASFFSFIISRLLARGYDFVVVQSAGNGDKNGAPCDAFYNGSFACIREDNVFTGISRISKRNVLDRIIIVGSAMNVRDDGCYFQSYFSNVGDTVDICAPGSDVFSCDIEDNGYYSYKSGTSMAAPVVTGIAALVWSVNPSLTGAQVRDIVCSPENSRYKTAVYFLDGVMDEYTYPLVNAKLSVEAAIATLAPVTETETETETEAETEAESGANIPATHPDGSAADKGSVGSNFSADLAERYRGEIGE